MTQDKSLLGIVHQFLDCDGQWRDCAEHDQSWYSESEYATRKLFIYTEQQDSPAQDTVKIPTTADEAELMAKLGMMWLAQNAPERLTQSRE